MRTRLGFALLALLFAFGVSRSAPVISTWEQDTRTIYSDTLGQAAAETTFTDSVLVFGARAITMIVSSNQLSGTTATTGDSIQVPVLQTKLPNGIWTYQGGASNLPPAGLAATTVPITTTSLVSTTPRHALSYDNEFSGGGTPVPYSNSYFRWRIRGANVRGNAAGGKAPSGIITFTIVVMK